MSTDKAPKPEGPRDATLADPPSSEAAAGATSEPRTPGLGSALPDATEGEQED